MIDTKLLRQKILDLAIRGKLVPQDPADEPASELLKKIKAEKDALVKAGKIKKNKHESHIFKGDDNRYYEQIDGKTADITDEIPFDLPDNWAWVRQASIITLISGQDFSPDGYNDSQRGIPYITGASNMVDGKVIINRWTENPSSIAIVGDVLITCKGAGVGKMAYMDIAKAHVARQVMAIRPHCNIPSKFIETVLQGQFTKIREQMNGLIPGISRDVMLNLFFPLPPLAEQQRIVEQIETLLGYVDIIDTDAETLEKSITLAKQKILDLAIRGKLVPQDPADEPASELLKKIKAEKDALVKAGKIKKDKHESFIFKSDDNCYHENIDGKVTDITDEIPFELANGWSWCRLNNVASLADGDWIESKDQAPTGFRLIQTGNIGKCVFLPHDERARYISQETFSNLNCTEIFPGDCLISRLPDPLGRSCIIPDLQERMITAVDCTITRPYKLGLSSLYFMYFTGTTIYNEYVEKNATGSTRKRISRANLDKVLIPLPPIAEQKRIVSQVEKLFSVLETMRG